MLPQDGHVHTQFSWDATKVGDMHATCARAVAIGLPSLAFTEHVDPRPWARHGVDLPEGYHGRVDDRGRFLAAPLDIAAYLEEIDRCRVAFPDLRILSGVELSKPHHYPDAVAGLLAAAGSDVHGVDRVIGSVHSLPDLDAVPPGSEWVEVPDAYPQRRPVEVVRAYLKEITVLAASDAPFEVLGHHPRPGLRSPDHRRQRVPRVGLRPTTQPRRTRGHGGRHAGPGWRRADSTRSRRTG